MGGEGGKKGERERDIETETHRQTHTPPELLAVSLVAMDLILALWVAVVPGPCSGGSAVITYFSLEMSPTLRFGLLISHGLILTILSN